MKTREFDEEERKNGLPKIPSNRQVPKYESPFAIPDDAEVADASHRSFE
jgi:hypothetical protein